MLINNKKNIIQHYMPVVHNVKKHRLICQLLIYSRLHQCLRILDVYRKLVASIPFIIQLTELSSLHINP